MSNKTDEYLKNTGFIIPGNEIYGGFRGLYDYGPLGVLLKGNIKRKWENFFVAAHDNVYPMEGSIFGSESCWRASGHIDNFHDFLIDCLQCKKRYREDHVPSRVCPNCGGKKWTEPREFNLIFKTVQENLYLRPETAQSIFINFKHVQRLTSAKLPFAIAQIGKAFRNEITMGNSIFRTLEFEQMECEWFLEEKDCSTRFDQVLTQIKDFLLNHIGFPEGSFRMMDIPEGDRAHYSRRSTDVEFNNGGEWCELWGIADRGTFDLQSHQTHSKKSMEHLQQTEEETIRLIPSVVEHSVGLNRLMYALVENSLFQEEDRTVLRIRGDLAPYTFLVLPLTKKQESVAQMVHQALLQNHISSLMLTKGSIGKRYKKGDSIGTPFCITIDDNSMSNLQNPSFTIRERDSKQQITMDLSSLIKSNFQPTF